MPASATRIAVASALLLALQPVIAAVWSVSADGEQLARALESAQPGDAIVLREGLYPGPIVIERPISLMGEGAAVIDGGGRGRVLTIDAPDTQVRGLTIRNSGADLAAEDSGVFVTRNGDRALIENNRLRNNLIGVYLKGPHDAQVRGNDIAGRQDLHMSERGDGIHIWNSPGTVVEANRIRHGRDGIFVTTSENNIFEGNHLADLRYGVHYMYTHDSRVSGNYSQRNHSGFALMFSDRLSVTGNQSYGDRDRGLFFNFANDSIIEQNRVSGGTKNCAFIYNSNFNTISGNRFEQCDIGIHFTAGSQGNAITGNAFIGNHDQVKYVGSRHLDWSHEGKGNYWSDHIAFDLDGNGIADWSYRPNDIVDQILWRFPAAQVLVGSPAFQLLKWAQSRFPVLLPGGVVDTAPLMQWP